MLKSPARTRASRLLRGWSRRTACAFLAIAFVASTAFGSAFYIWCIPMAKAMSSCCCHGDMAGREDRGGKSDTSDAVVSAPCCETRHFEKAATASMVRAEATSVPAPSWVTVPCVTTWTFDVPTSMALLTSQPARAGPPPPKIPRYIRIRSLLI